MVHVVAFGGLGLSHRFFGGNKHVPGILEHVLFFHFVNFLDFKVPRGARGSQELERRKITNP